MVDQGLKIMRLFCPFGLTHAQLIQHAGHGGSQFREDMIAGEGRKTGRIVAEGYRIQKAGDLAPGAGSKMRQQGRLGQNGGGHERDGDIPVGPGDHPGQPGQGRDQAHDPQENTGLETAISHIFPCAGTARFASGPTIRRCG